MVAATPRPIRLLPWSAEPGDVQLARGLAMLAGLDETRQPALRWYDVAPPALILGSSQRADDVNAAACAAQGIPLYRRASGGGAVLNAAMLSLDIALPPGDPLNVDDVTRSYEWLGELWARALQGLGIDARVIGIPEARANVQALPPLLKRVCFAGWSPYEVLVGDAKLVGLAQRRRRGAALLQAGLYTHWRPARTAELVARTDAERRMLDTELAWRVAGLNTVRPAVSAEAVQRAVEAELTRLGLVVTPSAWTPGEEAATEAALATLRPV